MRLTGREQVTLIDGIAAHYTYSDLSRTLRKIERTLRNIVPETAMPEVAQFVVDDAIMKAWLEDLIDVLLEDRPNQQSFKDIKAILDSMAPDDVGMAAPCHEHYLLPGLLPFLGRKQFRTIANHFNKPGRRILTVTGGSGTGKTYSKELVYHVASARDQEGTDVFDVVWVDLAPSKAEPNTMLTDGWHVITEIVNQIQEIELPEKYQADFSEQKEQASTWAKNVGSWLTGALSGSERIYWVIIDGFNEGPVAHSARLLIDDLIDRVGNNLTAVRLLLLDYNDEDFEGHAVRRHQDETKDLTDPQYAVELYNELGAFLLQVDAAKYESLGEQEQVDRIAEDANELLRNIDPGKGGQMQALADALERKAQAVIQGDGA